jgi:type II secretory pathway component HofQ
MKTRFLSIIVLALMLCACAAERKSVYYDPSEYNKIRQKQENDKKRDVELIKNKIAEGCIKRVYKSPYEDIKNVAQQVKGLLSPLGIVEVDEFTNSLIIYDKPEAFEAIENLLKEVD